MSGGTDISKIISLIMENPELIEKIKALRDQSEKSEKEETAKIKEEETAAVSADPLHTGTDKKRRDTLLCALKPYVSPNRAKAIDSMLNAIEVFNLIRGG